jgi:hypothetical protein
MGKGIVKLGEGNWAVKDGNLLAAKETNGRFKNAEFTVTRGTRATYVGRDGLIKESNLQDTNLVTNGTFDTDSDWSKSTGWSISGGKARRSGHSVNTDIQQNVPVVNGGLYKFSYTRAYESGEGVTNIYIKLDNVNYSTIGSYSSTVVEEHTVEGYFTTTFTGNLLFRIFGINDFTGTIDNISVQEVKTDTPRIDFTDNTDGHLLLEPQSTNLITYSEDFSNSFYQKIRSSITVNQIISPDGTQNADKFKEDSSNDTHLLWTQDITVNNGDNITWSVYAKKGERNWIYLRDTSAGNFTSWFDLENGVAGTKTGSLTANIQDAGNGWYRCSITYTSTSTTAKGRIYTAIADNTESYQGDGTSGVFIWGAQLEALPYATSYTPTNGSTVTRDAETCTGAGEAADFNSSEGVFYAEIAALVNDQTYRSMSLGDGNNADCVRLRFGNQTNSINGLVRDSGTAKGNISYEVSDIKQFHKVAYKYKSGDCQLWIDGVQRPTSTDTFTPSPLTQLNFNQGTSSDIFYGKCKAIRVYKETDGIDLATLTS